MAQEPSLDGGSLVGAQVVDDQVDVELGAHLVVDAVEELAEFDGALPPMGLSDDLAGRDIESREERRGADCSVRSATALEGDSR